MNKKYLDGSEIVNTEIKKMKEMNSRQAFNLESNDIEPKDSVAKHTLRENDFNENKKESKLNLKTYNFHRLNLQSSHRQRCIDKGKRTIYREKFSLKSGKKRY